MSKVNIKPLADRVLVEPAAAEEKTASGIIIPDTAKEKPIYGKVVAVGNGKLQDDGKRTKLELKKGDQVIFGKYSGTEVKIKGDEFRELEQIAEDVKAYLATIPGVLAIQDDLERGKNEIRIHVDKNRAHLVGLDSRDIALQIKASSPYLGPVFFVLFLLVGHSLNLVISALGSFVHPMRLTFVEFYKNAGFAGGGKAYRPFAHSEKLED